MIGAIAGDVIGSLYEAYPIKEIAFVIFSENSEFTDDTVLTVATAYAILNGIDYATAYKEIGRQYPAAGYGGSFYDWLFSKRSEPYNSWGNGSAMRVSPIGFSGNAALEVMDEALNSAIVTHNHPEGVKGAQAIALAVFLANQGEDKAQIKSEIVDRFGYDLDRTTDDIRPGYRFDVSCQGSVPEAIIAFLESTDFESAIRLAISLGGDSDTIACMAGGIAQAFYKEIPDYILENTVQHLPSEFIDIIRQFHKTFKLQPSI